MPVEPLSALGSLSPLPQRNSAAATQAPARSGFAEVLNGVIAQNTEAAAAADDAVKSLATGQAQDLHSVSLAVAKADLSFRLILEMRNRLTEAFQEVQRMQV
jgi:flagellar hook-basal body complex protein FliE